MLANALEIIYMDRIATHTGWCSGETNESTVEIIHETISLITAGISGISGITIGTILNKDSISVDVLTERDMDHTGSDWCDSCSCWDDVQKHEYARTILAIVAICSKWKFPILVHHEPDEIK